MCAFRSPRGTRETAGIRQLFTPVSRPNPLVIVWRWRYELATGGHLAAALKALDDTAGEAGLLGAAAAAAVLAVLMAASPPARRLAAARAWCVITPHRIRTGCAQAWVHSRYGKIPVVLWTSARPFGERVWVWCRAGTSPQDLESAREGLAVACWARDLQITRSPRHAHLAVIDVVRRAEPLAQARGGPLNAVPEPPAPWPPARAGRRTRPRAVGGDEHSDAA